MSQQSNNPQSQKPYNSPSAQGNQEKQHGQQFRPDQNPDAKDPKRQQELDEPEDDKSTR